jgi:hypothetical protein
MVRKQELRGPGAVRSATPVAARLLLVTRSGSTTSTGATLSRRNFNSEFIAGALDAEHHILGGERRAIVESRWGLLPWFAGSLFAQQLRAPECPRWVLAV